MSAELWGLVIALGALSGEGLLSLSVRGQSVAGGLHHRRDDRCRPADSRWSETAGWRVRARRQAAHRAPAAMA